MTDVINIGIAEDHDLVRQGFVRMLHDFANIRVLFEACNGRELLNGMKIFHPDIILLDIEMPVLSGIQALKKIRQRFPQVKVIVISAHSEELLIVEYIRLGASSFLPKNCSLKVLVNTIHHVQAQETYFDESTARILERHGNIMPGHRATNRELTDRETGILKLLCENKTNDEISAILGIQPKTIDWYKHKLMHKTHTADLAGLLSYGARILDRGKP